jgi:ubiquinone/menaquinone biosynthesis C-methylase UbiE
MSDLCDNWQGHTLARVYDYFHTDRSEEVCFWAELALPHGQRVLDLMCGTAEVSLGLARRGYRVVGVDRSPTMLAVAAERLAAAADYPARTLTLAQGDACAVAASQAAFDFAFVGGSGSFNQLDDSQARWALQELSRVLSPGGGLGLELVNADIVKELQRTRTFGPLRPLPQGVSLQRKTTNLWRREARSLYIDQATECEIDGERVEYRERFTLYVRPVPEIRAMLEAAGFQNIRLWGSHTFETLGHWSPDLLVVASTCRSVPRV